MPNPDESLASWGGPADMSAWEALMWRAEGDHRTRSTGVVVELLDQAPDWDRLVEGHERITRRIPRFRERVVEPLLPLVPPAWSPVEHFDLGYHLQRMQLPDGGTMVDFFAMVSVMAARPLDPNRPPWEAAVVTGLPGGRAAYLLKVHHSMSDGLGLLQLIDLTHGHSRQSEAGSAPAPRPAAAHTESPVSLLANRLSARVAAAPQEIARDAARAVGRFAGNPLGATADAIGFGKSLRRVLTPPDVPRSPMFRDGGPGYVMTTHDVSLSALKAAGKAAGGSVNDAFLAGLLGTFRRYHEAFGITLDQMPMAIPISLRTDNDPMGGNRFAGARFVAPVGEPDPAVRIAAIRGFISAARAEPAIGFLELIAPVLGRLPGFVLTPIAGAMTGASDLQASNIGAIGRTLYLAGARVTHVYPMGPRPGVAAMVTMITYDGNCCIGVNLDPDAISDLAIFSVCLRDGFDEVLALAGRS